MKLHLLLIFGLLFTFSAAAEDKITVISGYAPAYAGKQIELFQIMDYISMKQERIASATVGADSTFTFSFFLKETQKLFITCNNNKGYLYANPGGRYDVFMPDRNQHDPYRPLGNNVELSFFGLDSTDINYKILTFNRWSDEFLATFYTFHNAAEVYFAKRLDTFKLDVAEYYKNDSADYFFRTYVKYSLAKIDDFRFTGSRNQYEKYDFYLKSFPVSYQNDAYMEYVKHYYEKLMPRIDKKINESVYLALLKSSPTLMMRALGQEYTLNNNRKLRELIMIKILGESYYDNDYPQTNILTVLDSVSRFGIFEQNRVVASNVILRLTELAQGSRAPDFTIANASGELYNLKKYDGKYLYLFFVKPSGNDTRKHVELLTPIFQRYSSTVRFLMVIKKDAASDANAIAELQKSVPWESIAVDERHAIYSDYQVVSTPYYVLLDPGGYVVGAPALTPVPNGQYETIDRTFFLIKKLLEEGSEQGR